MKNGAESHSRDFCAEHVLRGWIWSVLFGILRSSFVSCLGLALCDWPLMRSMTQQLHASRRQLKDLRPFILLVQVCFVHPPDVNIR